MFCRNTGVYQELEKFDTAFASVYLFSAMIVVIAAISTVSVLTGPAESLAALISSRVGSPCHTTPRRSRCGAASASLASSTGSSRSP